MIYLEWGIVKFRAAGDHRLAAFDLNLQRTTVLPGCGQWTQKERASEVSQAPVEFAGLL